jgi:hypothetical protein
MKKINIKTKLFQLICNNKNNIPQKHQDDIIIIIIKNQFLFYFFPIISAQSDFLTSGRGN